MENKQISVHACKIKFERTLLSIEHKSSQSDQIKYDFTRF